MAALLATSTQRFGNVIKREYEASTGFCRKTVTAYDSAATWAIGRVLTRVLVSGTGTPAANAGNTGTGTVGTVTVGATALVGTYKVVIEQAVTDKGLFTVFGPNGQSVGTGQVASVFTGGGISFTISDATDFVVGDGFSIVVAGTEKYRTIEASDFSALNVNPVIFIGSGAGFDSLAVANNTDTTVIVIERGPVQVVKEGLSYGTSIDTTAEKNELYALLAAKGIIAEAQI